MINYASDYQYTALPGICLLEAAAGRDGAPAMRGLSIGVRIGAMIEEAKRSPAAGTRAALAIGVPAVGAAVFSVLFSLLAGGQLVDPGLQTEAALFFGVLGIISWLLGFRWYGRAGMGLRGGRPLYASIGFAVLGWVAFFVARLILVDTRSEQVVSQNSGEIFLYVLIFEAFCLQLWAYGLVFHAVADWRGPMAAATAGGVFFGAVAAVLYQEAFISSITAFLFFIVWGVFYGFIRLRTGSFLGTAIVQALQTLTVWYILLPQNPPAISELHYFYIAVAIIFIILIWRLWPKEETDYRV